MNLNKLLKWIAVFSLFIFTACNNDNTTVRQKRKENQKNPNSNRQSDSRYSSGNCKAKFISNKECFYQLPETKNNEVFTGKYEDILDIHTKGATIGKGQWLCQKGAWRPVYSPLCLTCLPEHSFEQCTTEWNNLRNNPNLVSTE